MKHPQIILVTGASSGFGRVIATQLAAQGHIVYGSSRKAVSNNPGFKMLQLDITDPASVSNAISTILKEQGSIDVLVNNAGMGISGAIELTTEEEIQRQMNTNFTLPPYYNILVFLFISILSFLINLSAFLLYNLRPRHSPVSMNS